MQRREFIMQSADAFAAAGITGAAAAQQGHQPTVNPNNDGSQIVATEVWPGKSFKDLLAGKVAVVIGAARGIGRAIAVDFAANGADVVGIDIAGQVSPIVEYVPATPADLEMTGKLVQQNGRKWLAITADIRDIKALRAAAAQAATAMGRIDIVVQDAAIQAFKPLLEMEDQDWHDVIDNNLNGSANSIRVFAPILVKQGHGGRIILIASMQGRYGTKNGSAYSASKWGIIGLMKSAALELGKHKITVNTIEPGLIDTAMTHNDRRWSLAVGETMTTPPPEHPTEEQAIQARLPKTPLGVPWLKPEQVSPVAVFLASDAAQMVTGACYDVNGGDSAHDLG
jgi:NAD(P)-dependent dehydrogenase (short-subunit alcohol dehydrogenase family)